MLSVPKYDRVGTHRQAEQSIQRVFGGAPSQLAELDKFLIGRLLLTQKSGGKQHRVKWMKVEYAYWIYSNQLAYPTKVQVSNLVCSSIAQTVEENCLKT